MRSIASRQNPIVARYRAAARGEAADVVLLDGVHLVAEALAARVPIHDVAVATVARGGRSIFDADYTGRVAILIGGEGPGLPESVVSAADERVTIPMQPPVESLNAAV